MRLPAALLACVVVVLSASAAPVPKALKAKRPDAEVFVGTWEVVSTELDGEPQATHAKVWEITADLKMKSVHAGGRELNWTLKLDPEKSPKEIDISSYKGIYEIDGDGIRVAYTTFGDRPTKFDPKPNVFVEVLRRAK